MRIREIWTLEVHDILEANQHSIKKFLEWWIKTISSKNFGKQMSFDEAKLMTNMYPKAKNGKGLDELSIRN